MPTLYLPSDSVRDEPAVRFLRDHGISYLEEIAQPGVKTRAGDAIPGATREEQLPVLQWGHHTLADFTLDDLKKFLRERGVSFEDS